MVRSADQRCRDIDFNAIDFFFGNQVCIPSGLNVPAEQLPLTQRCELNNCFRTCI